MRGFVILIACLSCVGPASAAGWSTWETNWTHQSVRSNLWAALCERQDAAGLSRDLVAPGWWVSKGWLAAFDSALSNTVQHFVDVSCVSTSTVATGIPMLHVTNAWTYGWWWPGFSEYEQRKAWLQASTTTAGSVAWCGDGASTNWIARYSALWSGSEAWTPPPAVPGHGTWESAVADVTNLVYFGAGNLTIPGLVGSPRKMSQAVAITTPEYGYSTHVAWSVPQHGGLVDDAFYPATVSTNWSKAVRLVFAADLPRYWDETGDFDSFGDVVQTNWSTVFATVTNLGFSASWTNLHPIGDTTLGDPAECAQPDPGTWAGRGWVGFGAWLFDWTADTNGFEYR